VIERSDRVCKRLRIIVPAVQVLAFLGVFALKLAVHMRVVHLDYDPFRRLVLCVDYPVWTIFLAVAYPVDRLMAPTPRWLSGAVGTLFVALLLSAIPLFWYFVVAEVGMRAHGASMLRFSGWRKELLAVAILLLLGGRAFVEAYTAASAFFFLEAWDILLSLAIARWHETLCILILTAWGIVLTGVAIHDVIAFVRGRARGTRPAAPL
jgi:hypothetical protein